MARGFRTIVITDFGAAITRFDMVTTEGGTAGALKRPRASPLP